MKEIIESIIEAIVDVFQFFGIVITVIVLFLMFFIPIIIFIGKIYNNNGIKKDGEDMIEKISKICERCNGEGKINIRREEQRIYDNWDPKRHGTYEWVDIGDECPNCRGKGYLELKWK